MTTGGKGKKRKLALALPMNCDDDGGDCAALLLNVIFLRAAHSHTFSLFFRSQSKEDGIINKKEMSYLLAHVRRRT